MLLHQTKRKIIRSSTITLSFLSSKERGAYINSVASGWGDVGDGTLCLGGKHKLVFHQGVLMDNTVHISTGYVSSNLKQQNLFDLM